MLRCLMLLSSAAMSSSRLIVLRSRTLATIRTYGRMREFTRVGSSSTKPSSSNVTFSVGAAGARTSSAAGSLTDAASGELAPGVSQRS
jgi:hypothetical protein